MQYFRSLVFTVFFFVFTALYSVIVAATAVLPLRFRYATVRGWAHAVLWTLKIICRLSYRVEGRENIPPGSHVSLWKHSSAWETVAMMVVVPSATWVLKRELVRIPLLGWGIAALRPIAIDRHSQRTAITQVVEQGCARLADGLWVVIFPEGTRMAAGETRRYGSSGALLASAARTKIIPVAHNAGQYWPRRGLLKRRGEIRVVIGEPIEPAPNDPRATGERVQRWIEATVASLGGA